MVLICTIASLKTITGFADLLVWPTGCDYYFYLKIFLGIMAILSWGIYKAEKKFNPYGADFLSCLGVVSIAVTLLGLIGSLITNTAGIPMISAEVLLYLLAIAIPIVLIWIFKD